MAFALPVLLKFCVRVHRRLLIARIEYMIMSSEYSQLRLNSFCLFIMIFVSWCNLSNNNTQKKVQKRLDHYHYTELSIIFYVKYFEVLHFHSMRNYTNAHALGVSSLDPPSTKNDVCFSNV